MKNTPHSFLNRFLALSLGLAVVALSPSARAATQTWTGATNGAWATSTNWNSAVPAATDTALWNSSSTANLAITLSAAQSVLGLQVLNPAGAVSLSGGTLTTGTGGIDMSAATQNLTISSGLTLGAGQTWTVATGQTLTLNTGAFTRTTGNTLLINDSVNTGTISTTNITTYPGTGYSASPIIGPWAIVESSGAAANNSANGYTYATVSGGNIVAYAGANSLTANSAWGGLSQGNHNGGNYDLSTTGTFTASGGSYYDPFTIRYTGAGFSQSQTIILYTNGIMNAGTGAFTVNEPIQQSDQGTGISSNEITLAAETAPINIAGAIENNGSKPFAVTVTGTSTVTLSGVNTTTGATTISNGSTLVIGAAGGWSTAYAGAISNFGTFTYGSSAAQTLSGVISGAGTLIQNGAGTLTLSNAANSYTGNITVNGGTLAASTAGSNGGNTVLGSDASAGRAITVNNGGILSFTTNDIFGNGTASAANIPSITVNSGGTLTTNNYNPLGNITLDGGTLGATGGSATTGYNVWQFLGSVTVGGNSASTISTFSGSNNADQLGSNTTFTVGVTGAAGGDLIVSAPLANQSTDFASAAGALTKAGPGTMLLSGVNTYTGATTVNAGTLLVTGTTAAGSAVAVNGGGTLGGAGNIGGTVTVAGGSTSAAQGTITLANNLATDTLTLGGLTVGGASAGQTSNLNIEVGNATADMLAITGGLTVNLGGVTVTITNLGVTSGQTYTLANFSGAGTYNGSAFTNLNTAATSVDGFTLSNPNITFGITGQLEITAASGGALELVTSGAATPATAYWKGSKGTQWASNNGTFGNFTTDAAGTSLVQAYPASTTTVIFAATGASNLSDSLGTNFNIAGLQFLAQDASSTTIGAVNITDPTYSLTIGSGGISDLNTNGVTLAPSNLIASTNESWTNGSGAALAITSPVAGVASVGNTATLTLSNTNSGATNISGAIGNGGNGGNLALVINDTGSAIVTLSGANTYSGGTTLTAGAVTLGNSSALGTGIVTINGGTLNLAGISPTIGNLQGSGGAISGTATDTLTVGGGSYSGILSDGTGMLSLIDAGTLTLSGENTYSGGTTINFGGTLQIGAGGTSGSLGSGGVTDSGTLTFDRTDSYDGSLSNAIGGLGAVNVNAGTLTLTGVNTYAGATTIGGGAALTISGAGSLGSGAAYPGNISNAGTFTYSSSASDTLSGVISGVGGLIQNSGTLTMTGASTFTGNVTVNGGTYLAANGPKAGIRTSGPFGNPQTAGQTVTINSGAMVELTVGNVFGSGGAIYIPSLTFVVNQGGTLETNAGDANVFGPITLDGGTFTTGNGFSAAFQSAIFLGTITAGGSSPSTINTNATNTSANSIMLGDNSITSNPSNTITFNVGATGNSGADLTVLVPLINSANGGTGALTKTGSGTMLLAATNTYGGATTVSAGTLIVYGALSSTSAVSATNGGILEADGLVNNSVSVAVNAGALQGDGSIGGATLVSGTLSPGFSPTFNAQSTGALASAGSVSLDSNSTFVIRLGLAAGGTDNDTLALAAGTVTLGNANLQLSLGGNLADAPSGTMYDIITDNTSNSDITGQFAQGSTIAVGGYTFDILYNENATGTGPGDDVVLDLVPVPEPQTWAMLLGGAAMLMLPLRGRRRSRSKN